MKINIIFKKQLRDYDFMPAEDHALIRLLSRGSIKIQVDDHLINITRGTFGATENEREVLSKAITNPSERVKAVGIPTLNFEIVAEIGKFDSQSVDRYAEDNWHVAYKALNRLLEGVRHYEYRLLRPEYEERIDHAIRCYKPLNLEDFSASLYYTATHKKKEFCGYIDWLGNYITFPTFFQKQLSEIENIIETGIDYERSLLINAREQLIREDFALSLLNSAIALELMVKRICFKLLSENTHSSKNQINNFIEETSRRFLVSPFLEIYYPKNQKLLHKIKEIFEQRNSIAHGHARRVNYKQAKEAIKIAEVFKATIAK